MNRSLALSLVAALISIILVASFVAYELGFKNSSPPSSATPQPTIPSSATPQPTITPSASPEPTTTPDTPFGVLWQSPIEHFANSFTVDEGKVFTIDETGDLYCFDSQNGMSLWNSTAGYYRSRGLVVSGSRVYAGFGGRRVGCLDKNTGVLHWIIKKETDEIFNESPQIRVKDGRLYATADGVGAYDAITGELLWQETFGRIVSLNGTWSVSGLTLYGDIVDGNCIYATAATEGDYSRMYFLKLDTDNGGVIWRSIVTWDGTVITFGVRFVPSVLASSQGKIIIGNMWSGSSLLCLDSNTGKKLWSMDVGAAIYSPTVYNNLLLFSASDGYVYAVNFANGTVAWKTNVDTQNLFSVPDNYASPSLYVDTQNQRLFWSFGAKQVESGNYTGTLCSLDLAHGNVIWTRQIPTSSNGLVVNNDKIFLTGGGLWIFNASTGDLVQSQQFDHYVLPPIVLGNRTFVVADLWLFAYGQSKETNA